MSKYDELLAKVKKATGIDTISLTIDSTQIIVDDYSVPKCLLHIGTMYDAMHVITGYPAEYNMSEQDLVDFNILEPFIPILNVDYLKPFLIMDPGLSNATPLYLDTLKIHKSMILPKHIISDDRILESGNIIASYRDLPNEPTHIYIQGDRVCYTFTAKNKVNIFGSINKKRLINQIIKAGRQFTLDFVKAMDSKYGSKYHV